MRSTASSRSCTTRSRGSSGWAISQPRSRCCDGAPGPRARRQGSARGTSALRALLNHRRRARSWSVRPSSKTWELDVVASTVDGDAASDERSVLRKLHDLAGLPVLDRERLNATITDLQTPCLRGKTARHRRGPRYELASVAAAGARRPRPCGRGDLPRVRHRRRAHVSVAGEGARAGERASGRGRRGARRAVRSPTRSGERDS